MRGILKWVGRLLAAVVVLVLIGAGVVYAASERRLRQTFDTPVDSVHVPTDSASVARGEHLVRNVIGCTICHGSDVGGAVYSSSAAIGTVAGPNLTRGKGGVGADYTDLDYQRAIRRGVRRDGRSLIVMPSEVFTHLSDEDMGAVLAFLKQAPPVDRGAEVGIRPGGAGAARSRKDEHTCCRQDPAHRPAGLGAA